MSATDLHPQIPTHPSAEPPLARDFELFHLRHWLSKQFHRTREAFPRRTCRACGSRSHYAAMTYDHGWFCDRKCAQHHWSDPTL